MTREQLLKRLSYYLDPGNAIGAALYFVLDYNGQSVIRFADIEDNAKNELRDRFLEYLNDKFIANEELHYKNISEADDRKNVVYLYDIDEVPESLNILNEILEDDNREKFNFNNDDLAHLQGYLIVIGNEGHEIALYKKHHPVNLLKQDRFLLFPRNERLVKADHDFIAMDKSFDCMLIDNNLIVLKLNTMERFFGFEDVVRNQAQQTIAAIEALALLEDVAQLTELAQDISAARKLMHTRNSPVLNLPVQTVINFINTHPELTGKLGLNEAGTRVKLTSGISKKLFLKLLNDDYLFSQLTQLQYETHAKDRLDQGQQS